MDFTVPPTYLAELNPHARDERIVFDEGPHIYYIDGSSTGYVSVTTFNHANFVSLLKNSSNFDWEVNEVDYIKFFRL